MTVAEQMHLKEVLYAEIERVKILREKYKAMGVEGRMEVLFIDKAIEEAEKAMAEWECWGMMNALDKLNARR